MQPNSRQKTNHENNETDSEIDIRALQNAMDWFLTRLTPFVKRRVGTVGARQHDFKVQLKKYREVEEVLPGLKDVLNAMEAAPAAGGAAPSVDAMLKFVLAAQSATAIKTGPLAPQVHQLIKLFVEYRAEWFPSMFRQDLPVAPDTDVEEFGGREELVPAK